MASDLVEKFGVQYERDSIIFKEGEPGTEMFIIQKGEVMIIKKSKEQDFVLAILKNGDFFGEMALFTDSDRVATAIASTDSLILKIDKTSFDYMIQSNIPFATRMIKMLCERLYKADQKISELASLSPDMQILKAIMNYWKLEGRKEQSGELLLFNYKEFLAKSASELDMPPEGIQRHILHLKTNNLVDFKKDRSGNLYLVFSPRVFRYFNII